MHVVRRSVKVHVNGSVIAFPDALDAGRYGTVCARRDDNLITGCQARQAGGEQTFVLWCHLHPLRVLTSSTVTLSS